MVIKTMEYTDFDGNTRTEEFRFHLNQAEVIELDASIPGGMEAYLKELGAKQDVPKIMEFFKKIIMMSYGVKTPDGRRFKKSEEISKDFEQTNAYSDLLVNLITDSKRAADFINGLIATTNSDKPVIMKSN